MLGRISSHSAVTLQRTRAFCGGSGTFIDKVKVRGANALLGSFISSNKFDRVLSGLHVDTIEDGVVRCSIPVDESRQNAFGTLHGGATSTIVDVVGTMALLTLDHTKPGVSIDLNVSFVGAAKVGTTVLVEGRVLKMGRSLGFTQVDLRLQDGTLVATGRHTKAFAGASKK